MRQSRSPASRSSLDDGFTLVEVIVAIVLIGASLMTLVGVSSGALSAQEAARRRQVASGIGNEVMERLRALNYDVLTKAGHPWGDISSGSDPNIEMCSGVPRLRGCSAADPDEVGFGEALVWSSISGSPACLSFTDFAQLYAAGDSLPLAPSHCTEFTLNDVLYRAYAYVTTTGVAGASYRLTVLVQWDSVGTSGAGLFGEELVVQSLLPSTGGLYGPSGATRDSSYSTKEPTLKVTFCRTAFKNPTSNCTSDTSVQVVVRLGTVTTKLVDMLDTVEGSATITAPSISINGVPMLAATPGASVDIASGGLASFGAAILQPSGETSWMTSDSWQTTNINTYRWLFLGRWALKATVTQAPECGPAEFACGYVAAKAEGKCQGGPKTDAPCVQASAHYGGVQVDICKKNVSPEWDDATPWEQAHKPVLPFTEPIEKGSCFIVARITGGSATALLGPTSSELQMQGFKIEAGATYAWKKAEPNASEFLAQAQVFRGVKSGDPYGIIDNIPDAPAASGSAYWAVYETKTSGCYAWDLPFKVQDSPGGSPCVYDTGTVNGAAPTQLWQLKGLASGGATWVLVGYTDGYCKYDTNTLVPLKNTDGDVRGCQQIAPMLTLEWVLADVQNATESPGKKA